MYFVILSLTEPPGLNFSSFMYSSSLGFGFRWFIFTIGVFPMQSKMLFAIKGFHLLVSPSKGYNGVIKFFGFNNKQA